MEYVLHLSYAIGLGMIIMSFLWLLALKIDKASIVDPVWSWLIPLFALLFALIGEGYELRKIIFTAMVGAWGLRLGLFIFFFRVYKQPEDGRYITLIKEWGAGWKWKLYRFYMYQALAASLFAVPALFVMENTRGQLHVLEWTGLALWGIAFVGESLADFQLESFKRSPESKGKTCRIGLWKLSRHPNYFFESLVWISYALFAFTAPYGYISLICPLAILYFLFYKTGIPKTEEQAIKSRGQDYINYQKTTSMFIPWFPKKLESLKGEE